MSQGQPIVDLDEFRKQIAEIETPTSSQSQIAEVVRTSIAKLKEITTEFTNIEESLRQDEMDQLTLVDERLENSKQEIGADLESGLKEIFDVIPFYVMLVDENHHILLANAATRSSLGLEPDQIIGKYCPTVVHGLDKPFPGCPLEEATSNNGPVEAELFDAEHDVWFQSAIYPTDFKTQDGRQILLHMVRDVTEKRRTLDVMRETNQTLQTLIQASPLAIVVLNIDGNVMIWNRAAERIFGWPELEILNHPCPGILKNDEDLHEFRDRILRGELLANVETISKRQDGSLFDISFSAAPMYDSEGNVSGSIVMLADITEKKRAEKELKDSFSKLKRTLDGAVHALALMAEKRDPYTAGHQQRVASLACAIARQMDLSNEQIQAIHVAGNLHDIGKMSIPSELLSKPSRLTETEFSIIKDHPQHGYDILSTIDFPWPVAKIVLQHHERIDGTGYPAGLSGENILLEARILAVADVVEAMASHRPYRPSRGKGEALEEISNNRGILYDSNVVDACIKLFTDGKI